MCEICMFKCKNLPRHIKCFHNKVKKKCPFCEKRLRLSHIESHIKKVHSVKQIDESHQEDGPFRNLRKRRTPFCRPDESAHSDDEFENGRHRRKTKSPMNIPGKEIVATDQPSDDADEMNEYLEEVLIDCAEHAKRKNVSPKDIKLARLIRYGL